MRLSNIAVAAVAATAVEAQRPSDVPICDYYTGALLKENTAANQKTLLTLLVNTVVIGNYTTNPAPKNAVPGILAAGKVNGKDVNLLPYFDGSLASSNRGGKAVSVNFLDSGGAAPLKMNKPANDTKSNQYFLLTHLYEFFGGLLGCSKLGMSGFEAYAGESSMYEVHKFMDLDSAEVTYFVSQVGLAAPSFGFAMSDITAAATAINSLFNVRCGPATQAVGGGKQLQSICVASDCPLAKDSDCSLYKDKLAEPSTVTMASTPASTATSAAGSMSGSATGSMTGSATGSATGTATSGAAASSTSSAAAGSTGLSFAAVLAGAAALAL